MPTATTSAEMPTAQKRATQSPWRRLRLVALTIGALAMAFGLWTGLTRLGVRLPASAPAIADFHGAFMISGFLGTLISLERAVALGRPWTYVAPLLSSVGALALLAGVPRLGAAAFICAGAVLLSASAGIAVRQLALFTVVLAVGAACWITGTLLWLLDHPTPAVVGWWLDFLILTIAAERLELSRMVKPPRSSQVTFATVVALLLFGSARGELVQAWTPFTAAGLMGCAAWLIRYDIARRTVRLVGQPRFSGVSILAGHVWLGIAGVVLIAAPPGTTAFSYDAAVHAITIGFVLSMIFGHAPIILPAVTGIRLRYSRLAYLSLALLHASLVVRIGGDLLERPELRTASGVATIAALIGYAATLALASRISRRGDRTL